MKTMFILNDRYNVLQKINLGEEQDKSPSDIYIAKDIIRDDKTLAIKIIELGSNVDNDILYELFRRECQSLSRLNHEKIVKYIDSGKDKNKLYLVMEYYGGVTLKKYVKDHNIEKRDKLKIAINICDALQYAHEKEVIHRDLKPTNIMINNPEDILIIDFGISKVLSEKYNADKTVRCFMTSRYAAPEQLMKYEAKIQSDIYSLGLTLAYLFCGVEPPEDRRKIVEYIQNMQCSVQLKNLILDMTKREENERPNSIYKIKRKFEKEYSMLCAESENLYIKFDQYIIRKLKEFGYVEYNSNEHVAIFLNKDLSNSYVSKNKKNNKYYLIGKEAKYTCEVDENKKYLKIVNVNVIDDHIQWEEEISKAIIVEIPCKPISYLNEMSDDNNYLPKLIQKITDEKRKRQIYYKNNEIKNKLLAKWEVYLKEEFNEVDAKKRLCKYKSFEVSDGGYKILIEVEDLDRDIEKNEILQLTSKNGEQISVGEFEGIKDEKLIIKLARDINPNNINLYGSLGIDTHKSTSNIKKFSRALKLLKVSDTANRSLSDIITDPSITEVGQKCKIEHYFEKTLSNSKDSFNAEVVKKALGTKDMFLIQGPPGTGKSTVITELVCQILKNNPNERILITSQSNVAVDHVINKISVLLPDKRIIRIGRSEKISSSSKNLMLAEQLNKWVNEVKNKSILGLKKYMHERFNHELTENNINDIEKNLKKVNKSDVTSKHKIMALAVEWNRRLGKLDDFDEIFANRASIIAATCLGIASRSVLNDIDFDWVIVDEAAKATALEILVPLVKGKKIVLVGDHKQLPPVVKIDEIHIEDKGIKKEELEESLFENLFKEMNNEAKVTLKYQYRMHPKISKLISDIFYPDVDIKTNLSSEDRKHQLDWEPRSIKWIDTSKCIDSHEVKEIQSKKNPCEAKVILKELEKIEETYEKKSICNKTIGIISGYDAQKRLLNDLIKPKDKKWKCIQISIDNVDAFQGSETDLVIYSIVRCNKDNAIGFLHDSRRLNVALSRGRNGLIIVGNIKFINNARSTWGNPFVDILSFMKKYSQDCFVEVYNEN